MNTSFMRYWQPGQGEQQAISWFLNSIACTVTYPIEFVKTHIQIRAEGYGIRQQGGMAGYNPHKVFRQIHAAGGGYEKFYHGFLTHYLSRISHMWVRNWIYYKTYYRAAPLKPYNDLKSFEKAIIGGFAGACAAVVSQPFEMLNVRAINDTAVAKELQRNYQSIGEGISKIKAEGGTRALYKGIGAHMAKMAAMNASMTGVYDFVNEWLETHFGHYGVNRLFGITFAAISGTIATIPFDNIKTRMMKQQADPALNRMTYYNSIDCAVKALTYESALSLWVGSVPTFYKIWFYAVFVVYAGEQMTHPLKVKAGLKDYQMYSE